MAVIQAKLSPTRGSVMQVVHELGVLRSLIAAWRAAGQRVALVPTMGNLHEGHYSLVDAASAQADRVVVSVFVNPTQFGLGEDYDSYSRTLEADTNGLTVRRCDLVFAPSVDTMYPGGPDGSSSVHVPVVSEGLCGEYRPGHFDGVATVVTKLFAMVQPDLAMFGEKDYQQLLVIRKLTEDLGFAVDIVGYPIVREADGLAMSSRNQYLSADERRRAPAILRVLSAARRAIEEGVAIDDARAEGWRGLRAAGLEPEYLEVRRAQDLGAVGAGDRRLIMLCAARLGRARLIDNLQFER